MKRIAILTAGGDTPALNATLHGVVTRANQLEVEVVGLLSGFQSLFNSDVPHIALNPSFIPIPELDPTRGGSILGCSRHYVDADDSSAVGRALTNLGRIAADGLICVGGDGTLNALQVLAKSIPAVLAPKTIDNDLGRNTSNSHHSNPSNSGKPPHGSTVDKIPLEGIINYFNPGYPTAVFVAAEEITRVRTTAETHRRIAIVEVMGRHSGFIALGSSYGQPDLVLIPESPLDPRAVGKRVESVYRDQGHAVIVCGEGIVTADGTPLGASRAATDPAGNTLLDGAAERLRQVLLDVLSPTLLKEAGGHTVAEAAVFTRKVGHTQRGGRPITVDRVYASQLGGHALSCLLAGENNSVAGLRLAATGQLKVSSHSADVLCDEEGVIHARQVHPSFYDETLFRVSDHGASYLAPVFSDAIGDDDFEYLRQSLFDQDNPLTTYRSVNRALSSRIQRLP